MNALQIRNLTKTYHNGVTALKGIDLEVAEGDFFALLGPNGAGKSTTIGIITSLVNKTDGTVEVFGVDTDKNFPLAKSYIGVVPQEFNFNIFEKVQDILINQAGFYGIERPIAIERSEKILKDLGLWDKRNQISRNLSGGMKRRLMIARALVHNPRLLILDEPTAGVDIELRRSMYEFLRKINAAGTTIILTTHYLEEAENLCRNVAIIDRGIIITNTTVRELVNKLDTEQYIFYVKAPLQTAPVLENYRIDLIDSFTIEIELKKNTSLNHIFSLFSQQDIEVLSFRNKTNRLEEMFIRLTNNENQE
jgi:ABC-2 type transport system ATP-binding protein